MSQASTPFNSASASWEDHRTAFFQAVKAGDKTTIETVVKKYPEAVEWEDAKGTPPLHVAFAKRDLDTFKFLLEKGAKPYQKVEFTGMRAFFSTIFDPSILEVAVKAGEKPYIVALLQRSTHPQYVRTYAPKNMQAEISDLLKRERQIRLDFLYPDPVPGAAAQVAPAASTPAVQVEPKPAAAADDIKVMKPAQIQRRTPNASA